MSNRKNYNSIVFLTTLSLYLGLVLAGGTTPTVLAQAATTRNFDIKSEIVVEDDLDKKPDDDAIKLSGATGGYFNDLEWLIEDLQELHQDEKFNLDFDTFEFKEAQIAQCNLETIRRAVITSRVSKVDRWIAPAIEPAISRFESYAFLGDCLPNDELIEFSSDEFGKKEGVQFELETSYDKAALKVALSITKESPQRAKQLLDRFNQAQKIYELDEEEIIIKKIYENTTFSSENNQVFIVTRLPRASIDDLTAGK